MLKAIILIIFQCLLLASGQVCFKFAVEKITKFQLSLGWFSSLLTNWWLLGSGILLVSATVLWGFILKHFPFSVAYPVTAFAYVFGLIAAVLIFGENVPATRWFGVFVIIIGVYLITK